MWLLKKIPNNRPRNCLFQPSLYDSKAIQCECLRSPSIVNIFLSHFPASLPSISCFNDQFKVVILSAPKTLFNRRSSEISNVAWRSRSFSYFVLGPFFVNLFSASRESVNGSCGKSLCKSLVTLKAAIRQIPGFNVHRCNKLPKRVLIRRTYVASMPLSISFKKSFMCR